MHRRAFPWIWYYQCQCSGDGNDAKLCKQKKKSRLYKNIRIVYNYCMCVQKDVHEQWHGFHLQTWHSCFCKRAPLLPIFMLLSLHSKPLWKINAFRFKYSKVFTDSRHRREIFYRTDKRDREKKFPPHTSCQYNKYVQCRVFNSANGFSHSQLNTQQTTTVMQQFNVNTSAAGANMSLFQWNELYKPSSGLSLPAIITLLTSSLQPHISRFGRSC